MKSNWQLSSAGCLLLLLLTSCGFHLRGMCNMPRWLNNTSIIVQNANRDLGPLLSDQLKTWNIQVCPDAATASYWLIIEEDHFQQQISSISSSTTPRQYQLIYTVKFKLQQAKGKDIIPDSQVVVSRQITINSDRILGSSNEEEHTKNDLRRDAVNQIIERLSRAHEH